MQEWKQALGLAMFELKASLKGFLFVFLLYTLLALSVISTLGDSVSINHGIVDLLFLLAFGFVPLFMKPKEFQYQKDGDFWGLPFFIMLSQLPITKKVLVQSRFILYFIYSFPFQFLLLALLYVLNADLQGMLSPLSYITFSIIWLSFGVYMGYMMPASDAGYKANTKKFVFDSIAQYGGSIALFVIYQYVFDYGIVYWTVIFAQKWPFLSLVLSIVLALFGCQYWKSYLKKKMGEIDYL